MNCKPGDLAVVLGDGPHAGRLVEVLATAPMRDFRLPDGALHEAMPPGCWILRSLGAPFTIDLITPLGCFKSFTDFPCMPDSILRPLRGLPEHEHQHQLQEA